MPRPLRVCLAQLTSSPSVETNMLQFENAVSHAASQGCQLIVFPEYYTQGIVAESPEKIFDNRRKRSDSLDKNDDDADPRTKFAEVAKQHGIDIVVGTLVEHHDHDEESDGKDNVREHRTYNTAYYIDKHGNILGQYRKRNLWHPEKDYLHPGKEDHLVFQTEYAKTGMLVCWDLAWPEAFRALFMQGVELIVVPTYWTADDLTDEGRAHDPDAAGESQWLDSLVVSRAYENECVVVFVNCGGPREQGFLGRSAVAAPLKGCIGRTDSHEAQLKVVDVDLDVIKAAKKVYQIREDYEKAIEVGGFSRAGN